MAQTKPPQNETRLLLWYNMHTGCFLSSLTSKRSGNIKFHLQTCRCVKVNKLYFSSTSCCVPPALCFLSSTKHHPRNTNAFVLETRMDLKTFKVSPRLTRCCAARLTARISCYYMSGSQIFSKSRLILTEAGKMSVINESL